MSRGKSATTDKKEKKEKPAVKSGLKTAAAAAVGDKKKKRVSKTSLKNSTLNLKTYIRKVLRQVHPDIGISSSGMEALNGMLNDVFERILEEAKVCKGFGHRGTMQPKDIISAATLLFDAELGKHARAEATKALAK